jgi:tRNA/rRNA methyltransferase
MVEIHFILYKPAVPGNVGAAARAIKTMGFRNLRLIDPCQHLSDEARMMAHGSFDVLESARVCTDIEDASADLDMLICTTARGRTAKHEYHSSRELSTILQEKQAHLNHVGILFGTEESGLPNSLILRSDMAVSIPMSDSYPSLNLAQAVMVTAYELSQLNPQHLPGVHLKKSGEGWGEMKTQAGHLMESVGIHQGSPLYHRIMERLATVSSNDIPLFLSVLKKVNAK